MSPTIREELQRKHEQALVNLAGDYDTGEISFDTLRRAFLAVDDAVSGLVDVEAITEMSAYIKAKPSPDIVTRVYRHKDKPVLIVLSRQQKQTRMITVGLRTIDATPQSIDKSFNTIEEAEQHFAIMASKLSLKAEVMT